MAPTAFVAKRAVAMLSFLWFNYFSKAITTATETVSPLLFQFTYIKTPQLIGIVLGCCVFGTTVVLVFLLLYYSGSFSKLAEELQADATGQPIKPKSVPVSNSAVDTAPELYEELLLARKTVFLQPKIPLLTWEDIELVQFDSNSSIDELYSMCNGSAQFHECEYPPASLWDWLDTTVEQGESIFPYRSLDNFKSFYCKKSYNGCHVIIFDNGYRKGIGMISLVDNHPNNLSIRLGKVL